MKKILIINGHPDSESFCFAIHQRYRMEAIEAGNEVEEIILADMAFNPVLKYGYRKRTELEPDLLDAWKKIERAEHIVWIYPIWWGVMPALMKGFVDRLFLPGFAYEYQEKSPFPKKLLTGKTSEIIVTMDTPLFYYKLVFKNIGVRMVSQNICAFCGIKNKRATYFYTLKDSTSQKREQWLNKVAKLAHKLI